MGLRDKILNASDIKAEEKYIEEWDATIEVRSMNGAQRARLMREGFDRETQQINWDYASVFIAGAYDPGTGELIFTEADRDALNEKHGGILEDVAMEILRLSGLSDASLADAEKNS
jgi:hypothetical protein